uniref:AMP-dependent synthetase/ligase domain-containing protein n=1 Tax=Fusarium oxysporum (strain Fo5176) TaxID=660025 RepID=A0A0D2YFJ0_FUSOF
MSGPPSRIRSIVGHLRPQTQCQPQPPPHIHHLSPTFFLERAAAVESNADAIFHITTNGVAVRRSYQSFADRARGLAYYFKKYNLTPIGILAPNTPAFLEPVYGIVAGGGVIVPANYRLQEDDIAYIFEFAEVDCIIVDKEFENLLGAFTRKHPQVPLIVDLASRDTDATDGPTCEPFNQAILEGLAYDTEQGSYAWATLQSNTEDGMLAIPFTSGTTSRPKGVVYTHRGAYLAAVGNIIESGLNHGRFHAMGWTFPWSVVAVRGLNVCLRKIDYPLIWKLLKEEGITHFNAAPTVNTLLVAAKEAIKLPHLVQVTVTASPPEGHLFEQMANLNLMPVHVYGMTGILIDVAKDGQEIGEIIFSGNSSAKEYYKDAEATQKLFAGGALHSGDLAVWHPGGSAQILDRAKDIIISGGENISSVALESMLVQHPDILEAGVVPIPDYYWGERSKAYITGKIKKTDLWNWAKKAPKA